MNRETVEYTAGDVKCHGYFVSNEIVKEPRPAIIIAHAWKGQDDFVREKANTLAKQGFVAFCADLYGEGKTADTNEEATELMSPLFINRKLLRERIIAAHIACSELPLVDKNNIAAIGFCFGGLTVIELLRSGASIKGAVSFHGLLGKTLGEMQSTLEPNAEKMHGALLILHGYQDLLVSKDDVLNIQKEMTDAGVDWQMHIYGNSMHAFTNPDANDKESGILYNSSSEKRSFESMNAFFKEIFS